MISHTRIILMDTGLRAVSLVRKAVRNEILCRSLPAVRS